MTGVRPPTWAVEVEVPAPDSDLAAGLLWGAGVSAVSEAERGDGTVLLTCDVPPEGIAAIESALGGRWAASLVAVGDDGLDSWREHAAVTRAGEHLVVQPPWVPYDPLPGDVVVAIDPGTAFGHGAHPTTRLCLSALERLVAPGTAVLDVGCGSGVLAVAAALLGAEPVLAIDLDPAAVAATDVNATANGLVVEASGTPVEQVTGAFDVVVANIGTATLVELARPIGDRLSPAGTLVVSGMLESTWEPVARAFEHLGQVDRSVLEGWVALEVRRESGSVDST